MTTGLDAADKNLYVGQQTATANLPADAIEVEAEADVAYAEAVRDRDSLLAAHGAEYVHSVAAAQEGYESGTSTWQQFQDARDAAAAHRDELDREATDAFQQAASTSGHYAVGYKRADLAWDDDSRLQRLDLEHRPVESDMMPDDRPSSSPVDVNLLLARP